MNALDIFIQNYFLTARIDFATEFLYVVTTFFDVTSQASLIRFTILVLCVAVLIYLIRNLKYSILFVCSLLLTAGITYILKLTFNISRPVEGFVYVVGYSFPSYHATTATVFFVMLMYIFDSHMGFAKRIVFNLFCIISIILVSVSRLYLGVHWLSDVVGGIVLGVIISFIVIRAFKQFK